MYVTKEEARGAAAFIQGYEARLGLGITRTRNQIREPNPVTMKKILNQNLEMN